MPESVAAPIFPGLVHSFYIETDKYIVLDNQVIVDDNCDNI